MNTPICDFVKKYCEHENMRLHMPGHKGKDILGIEHLDITEIKSADSLYEAQGIIRESEENASRLFGCDTYYSTEGSSQCIRAMLYLATLYAASKGEKASILAARNAHKTFLTAAALLDFDLQWIFSDDADSYLACNITPAQLDLHLTQLATLPTAVYITSPDYLGNTADVENLAKVCHRHGVLLIVDNAHGAYLKFLPRSLHPIDLGADMCCDSAHKTLSALTGAAYLHVSPKADKLFSEMAKPALALFGSTSPSYLILQSLDTLNLYLGGDYRDDLAATIRAVNETKSALKQLGYTLVGNEPLKITIAPKDYGYTGVKLEEILTENGIICEFSDPDFLVLMLTTHTKENELCKLTNTLGKITKGTAISSCPPPLCKAQKVMDIRNAVFSAMETIPAEESLGRVLAFADVSCPPAVPIVLCGERIDSSALEAFEYYSISTCTVIKE